MTKAVTIHEVGPRDGLQNEPGVISTGQKVTLIKALAHAGLRQIEVGSFVSPKWVPQMADTPAVLARLPHVEGMQYDVLVPNMRGWEGFEEARRALGLQLGVAVFISATEGFSRANLNCSVAESLERAAPVVAAANRAGVPVRGYVSCVTDCPYDGAVEPGQVAHAISELRRLTPMPVSLGDTIGKGTPERVAAMLEAAIDVAPVDQLAGHFHDTGGRALDNVRVALETGLRHFDSAVGGLGGCPYAPGAPGNLDTGALVGLLDQLGFKTGVELGKLDEAAKLARQMRGRANG